MRIIFMGTPEFAVASLTALLAAGEEVVAVVTAPDRPAGRGQKLQESAVKKFAAIHSIPILQPIKLKDPSFLSELARYKADLQVVVAFRMLPEVVWNMPPKGTINLHASLLPQYRGAAPINHAIINGEEETGVSTFMLQQEIDTGNILLQAKVGIQEEDNAGILHDKLMVVGAALLAKTVNLLKNNALKPIPQDEASKNTALRHAPKIFKEDCLIEWNAPAKHIYDKIRGLSPYPTAFTEFQGKSLKLFEAKYETKLMDAPPGTVLTDNKRYLHFAAEDGYVAITQLQLEGKKKMAVEEFLRGIKIDS